MYHLFEIAYEVAMWNFSHLPQKEKLEAVEATMQNIASLKLWSYSTHWVQQDGNRRSQVPCMITGEPTYNTSGLSTEAYNLILDGIAWQQERERRKLANELVRVAYQFPWGHNVGVAKLAEVAGFDIGVYSIERGKTPEDYGLIWLPDFQYPSISSNKVDIVFMPQNRVDAFKRMVNKLQETIKRAADDGLRDGSALLRKLATNEITIEDYNSYR